MGARGIRPPGLKPAPVLALYAALKRRSSTAVQGFKAVQRFRGQRTKTLLTMTSAEVPFYSAALKALRYPKSAHPGGDAGTTSAHATAGNLRHLPDFCRRRR